MKPIKRRKTRLIKAGRARIGGKSPISVQSMTNTDTRDVRATVRQIKGLERAGCEIIRVAVPDIASAKVLKEIKRKINIPLVADIHFDPQLAIESINRGVDGIRINPGNIGGVELSLKQRKEIVKSIVEKARTRKVYIRVGVNSGSLDKDLLRKYKDKATPEALAESALRSIRMVEKFGFRDIVVSLKSTDVLTMVRAHEILAEKGDWPFHLGVTEAGMGKTGIVKSAMGIGSLLLEGIGDTIRVSLSGPPVEEVKVGWEILKSLKLREKGLTVISCPTCARTKIEVANIAKYIESFSESIEKPFTIAVMGCIVNGLGEAQWADLAIVGLESKKAAVFKKGKFIKNIQPKEVKPFLKAILTNLGTTQNVKLRKSK